MRRMTTNGALGTNGGISTVLRIIAFDLFRWLAEVSLHFSEWSLERAKQVALRRKA